MQIDRYNRHSLSDIVVSATVFIVIAVFIIFVVGTVVNEMYRIDEGMIVNRYIVWDTVNKIPRSSYVFVIEGEKDGKTVRYSCYVSAKEYDTYRIGIGTNDDCDGWKIRRKAMLIRIDGPEFYVTYVLKKVGVTYQKITSVFKLKGPGYLERHEMLVANIGALPKFMEVLRKIPQSNVLVRQPDFEARQKYSDLVTTENQKYYELPMIITTMGKRMI